MNISYEGIGHMSVTFPADDCAKGAVCILDSEGTAAACSDGSRFVGLVEHVEGGRAAVQIHGFAAVKYSGTAPSLGYVNLSADATGGVKADSAGQAYLAVAIDTTNKYLTIEL